MIALPQGLATGNASMADQQRAEERRKFCLGKAEEAEERAVQVKDLESRRIIEQIAQSWRLLARNTRDYP